MYPVLRLARVIAQSKFQKNYLLIVLNNECIHLMVLPQDIDLFMELNNGRYTLLDLGRFSYGAKVDMGSFLKKQMVLTIVGTYNEYRHRLRLFQDLYLKLRLLVMMKMVLLLSKNPTK